MRATSRRKVTSATAEPPFAHEQAAGSKPRIRLEKFTDASFKSRLKNQSTDCAQSGVERQWGLQLEGERRPKEKGE